MILQADTDIGYPIVFGYSRETDDVEGDLYILDYDTNATYCPGISCNSCPFQELESSCKESIIDLAMQHFGDEYPEFFI